MCCPANREVRERRWSPGHWSGRSVDSPPLHPLATCAAFPHTRLRDRSRCGDWEMVRKPKTEAEKLAEFAKSAPFTEAALSKAVLRLVRKNAEVGQLLIREVLAVGDSDPKRFCGLEDKQKWLDMAGISALAIVKSLEREIRMGQEERQKDEQGPVAPELIHDEAEDATASAFAIVEQVVERTRQIEELALTNQQALQKLSLLLL